MAELSLEGISKYFGKNKIIDNFTLDVADGEFVVLVGPSGCGKSTILRMIAGLESLSTGLITINGMIVNDIAPKDRDIAMVFQNYNLYPHMTVFENMAFALKMRKFSRQEILSRVTNTAEILGVDHLLNYSIREISGGQQQRVALGRAIIRQPKIFLFDEPLSNLDAGLRLNMRSELIRLHNSLKSTMIYVTHDQTEAMSMSDRLVVINNGRIQQIGPPLEIYNNPANMFVAGFIGSPPMNFISCEITKKQKNIHLVKDGLRLPVCKAMARALGEYDNKSITVGLRPEDFMFQEVNGFTSDEIHPISIYIEYIEPLGSEILATCQLADQTVTMRFPPDKQIKTGDNLNLFIRTDKIKLFDHHTGESVI